MAKAEHAARMEQMKREFANEIVSLQQEFDGIRGMAAQLRAENIKLHLINDFINFERDPDQRLN